MPKGPTGDVDMLRWTGRSLEQLPEPGEGERRTLQAGLDYVERVDGERGDGAGGQAGDSLDQRGREARMVFVHKGRGVVDVLMARFLRGKVAMTTLKPGK